MWNEDRKTEGQDDRERHAYEAERREIEMRGNV